MNPWIDDASDEEIIGYIDRQVAEETYPIEVTLRLANSDEALACAEALAQALSVVKASFISNIQGQLSSSAESDAYVFRQFLALHDLLRDAVIQHDIAASGSPRQFKTWGER